MSDGDQRPWIEKMIGKSWDTTLAGVGGALFCLLLVAFGLLFDNHELVLAGLGLVTPLTIAIVSILTRSQHAHTQDKKKGET